VFVAFALVEDISTVFLYNGFFLKRIGLGDSLLFTINQIVLKVAFVCFRFLFNFVILFQFFLNREKLCSISVIFFVCGIIVFSKISVLNMLWLFRLLHAVELFRGVQEFPASETSLPEKKTPSETCNLIEELSSTPPSSSSSSSISEGDSKKIN